MDGTLWNSVDLVVRGWNRALEEAGRPCPHAACTPERGFGPLFGKTMDEIALALLPGLEPEKRRDVMSACMAWEDRGDAAHKIPATENFLSTGQGELWRPCQPSPPVYRQQLPGGLY
ncbi:MAG: HAD family hydrolase [Oscillospiraceae bacterium]